MRTPPTEFSFPTPTFFGANALEILPGRLTALEARRPLVVTDEGLLASEAFTHVRRVLGSAREGEGWFVFSGVHSNPLEADVRAAAVAFGEAGCDSVIGFGGGSVLDVAKAVRLLVKRPGLRLHEYDRNADWRGLLPFTAIPTTAGTGSEVGRSAVITLEQTGRKAVLGHPELLAKLVILDPVLTCGLPAHLTAATGMDALTHCIESFTCPTFHPMCDGIALEGVHLIVEALPRAYGDGTDLEARGRMLVAAAMGAVAFQKDLGAVHSLAHPLSTLCGMHHGTANALCLPAVMGFNAARQPGLYRRVGLACGLDLVRVPDREADEATVGFLEEFARKVGLSPGLAAHGVNESQFESLVEQAFADPCHRTNPVPVTAADLRELYRAAL